MKDRKEAEENALRAQRETEWVSPCNQRGLFINECTPNNFIAKAGFFTVYCIAH